MTDRKNPKHTGNNQLILRSSVADRTYDSNYSALTGLLNRCPVMTHRKTIHNIQGKIHSHTGTVQLLARIT